MKILLAIDGSTYSDAVVQEVIRRPWPGGSEVELFSAVYAPLDYVDPMMVSRDIHQRTLEKSTERAKEFLGDAEKIIRKEAPQLAVTTKIVEGSARDAIVDEAAEWGADLIMLGSHGYGAALRLLLGSVSHAVAQHAPCSVEIVRAHAERTD